MDSVLQDTSSPYDGSVNVGVPGMGSIVITIATDAPLLPHQCTRLAHGHEQSDRTERPGQGAVKTPARWAPSSHSSAPPQAMAAYSS